MRLTLTGSLRVVRSALELVWMSEVGFWERRMQEAHPAAKENRSGDGPSESPRRPDAEAT